MQEVMDFEQACARLETLSKLETGWDSYGAEPPNEIALAMARAFLKMKLPTVLNPSVVGGIGMTFRTEKSKDFVYVEFRNTGNIHAAFITGTNSIKVCEVIYFEDTVKDIEEFLE